MRMVTNEEIREMREALNAKDLESLPLVRSENGGLLTEKLESCFRRSPNYFDKHCEPRKDQNNLDGLSFKEELNLSKYLVKKALKEICVHYKSELEYLQATDKFQGSYYCSYLNIENHRRTRYFRNNELVDFHLDALLKRLLNSTDSDDKELPVKE